MRSGDRPTGNRAATDQSAGVTDANGKVEDIDAGEPAKAVRPADQAATDQMPRVKPGDAEEPAAEQQPGPGDDGLVPRQRPRPDGWRSAAAGRAQLGRAAERARAGLAAIRLPLPQRPPGQPSAGGTGFARITVLPAILVMAWLLPGLPLLLAGAFVPVPMLLIAAPLAVVLAAFGLRQVPGNWPRALPGASGRTGQAGSRPAVSGPAGSGLAVSGLAADPAVADGAVADETASAPRRERAWPAWWGLGGTAAVAAGFALWQFLFNSETVIVLRDPGAYLQTGYWIAQQGALPIPQSLAAFGGTHPGLGFSSIGFFTHGTAIVPGLMSGLPMILAGGFWVQGTTAAAALGPVLGGLAILAFGGLAGRLTGPQWAPAGALVLALTLPQQYTSRGSFTETAGQVLLFGGLCLVIDALTLGRAGRVPGTYGVMAQKTAPNVTGDPRAAGSGRDWSRPGDWYTPQRALMALGGLALGLTALVRVGALVDVLPAIPFVGLLVLGRTRTALAFCLGLVVGVGYALADGYLLARPFLESLRPVPELIGLIAAGLAAVTWAAVELARLLGFRNEGRTRPPGRLLRWLPDLGAALAVAALIGLAIRPYLQTARQLSNAVESAYVASLQQLQNLPVDPGRTYAEDTLYWVIWYLGLPAVLLGGFGLALLIRWCLRALISWRDPSGLARIWGLPLAVICCGSAAVLWYPATVPDQPWASRRLVPLVLPGLIICALWASAWLRGRARSRGAGQGAASVAAAFCVAALIVPAVQTSFGLGLGHSGQGRAAQASASGLALKRTGQGQYGAVAGLCSAIGPTATVVIVDRPVAERFSQVIRGMCGVPVASMAGQPATAVRGVLSSIASTGRRPVLLGSRPGQLAGYGGSPLRVLDLATTQDPHTLTQPPTTLWPAHYVIWMSAPSGANNGV
ncbi:MAG TPA: hypothetical protein VH480_02860 [Streptosporangiaceae bacterium]